MSLTLTIGGTNYKPKYKTNSASIRERLANSANTLSLTLVLLGSDTVPQEGSEIIFKDGSRTLFAGYVSRVTPTETGEGQLFSCLIEATDYTYVLSNKVAQSSYESETLSDIVNDLISTYVDSGYGITTSNVATGPTITTVSFNYISLTKCFQKLAQITGYSWWIDYDGDIHFVASTTDPAPEDFTDSSNNFMDCQITLDTSQLRNSVIVRGGNEETSSSIQEEFLGDAVARSWTLREKPKTMVSIELDTGGGYVAQTYAVDPIDEEGSNYFMFNYQEKYVRLATGSSTSSATHKVRVTYNYEVPVLVKVQSAASIAAIQAIEGGDGIHDYVINRSDVKSKDEARQIALNDIADNGNPILKGVITTRTGLLSGGSYFHPGQVLTVNLPTWSISTDTDYLIQEVGITLIENVSTVEYTYTVTFGGRLIGIREFLEGLAGLGLSQPVTNEDIDKIQALAEDMTIAEVVARDPNLRSVSETATISEATPGTLKTTPPFKWKPSGTKGAVWNEFEWG